MEKNSTSIVSKSQLSRRRDNLAALIEGFGGQIPDAKFKCNCEDCVYLRPLIAELEALDNELRYN